MTIPFGKFKGRPLAELPDDYLGWLFSLGDLREPLRSAVDREWHRRLTTWPLMALATLPIDAVPIADELVRAGYRALTRRDHPDAGGDHRTAVRGAA
jgi:Putative quorum-sensing-regulated virulence factor